MKIKGCGAAEHDCHGSWERGAYPTSAEYSHTHTHTLSLSLSSTSLLFVSVLPSIAFSLLLVTPTQVWLHLRLTGKKYQIDYDSLLARLGGWRAS